MLANISTEWCITFSYMMRHYTNNITDALQLSSASSILYLNLKYFHTLMLITLGKSDIIQPIMI